MAAPNHETKQYSSEQFVESCGAILFHVSTKQICLVQSSDRGVWLLAKGRRNIGERRVDAAVREAREETGFRCRPMIVDLYSRATPWEEAAQTVDYVTPDVPRFFEGVSSEPFMITYRVLPPGKGVKLIYWYLAAIDEGAAKGENEALFSESRLFGFDEALQTLTYSTDREIVKNAIEIFEATERTRQSVEQKA